MIPAAPSGENEGKREVCNKKHITKHGAFSAHGQLNADLHLKDDGISTASSTRQYVCSDETPPVFISIPREKQRKRAIQDTLC